MVKPAVAQVMTRRGWLLRGESVVASTGLALAVILLAGMATAAWWTLRTDRDDVRARHLEKGRAVGMLLAQSTESLLNANELSAARRLVSDAARSNGFSHCRIVVGDGSQIIADADPSKINSPHLPDKWESTTKASEGATEAIPEGTMVFPIEISGRGEGQVELSVPHAQSNGGSWEALTGLGGIGAGCMLGLLMIYRRMRSRLGAMGAIREALLSRHAGEKSAAALAVGHEDADEAQVWNEIVAENDQMRQQLLVQKIHESRGAPEGSTGDLAGVCDAMWQGLVLIDEKMRIKYANGAAAVMMRAKRDELIGKDASALWTDETVLGPIRKVVSGTLRRRITAEVRLTNKPDVQPDAAAPEGENQPAAGVSSTSILRFNVRPVRRGDTAAAMVIIEDVTQQRLAEEARNHFVAQATHELRMPLTNIRLYTESALEEGEHDVALRAKCLNVINQESRRLERIVGDMLSVAEIEAGTLKLRPGDVRLDTLFEELNADYQAHAKDKGVALNFNLPPKLPAIRGDRDKIVLALHNLIGNAIKYTPSGGSVEVQVEVTDKLVVIDVADTGIGIRPEETELIFEKFYRSNDERIGDITGSGLGLAVAREIIRMHRGDITVRSHIDEGSTFTLTVPTMLEAA